MAMRPAPRAVVLLFWLLVAGVARAGPGDFIEPTGWERVGHGGLLDRARHGMVYDALRDRVVVFGGTDLQGQVLGDTWLWLIFDSWLATSSRRTQSDRSVSAAEIGRRPKM